MRANRLRANRRGFTFIEILIVLIVMGILAAIAITRYVDLKHRALSARATSDLEAVRYAAYSAMYQNGDWPPDAPAGALPPAMTPHLGAGFSFSRPEYTLDWENLGGGGGGGAIQVGVTVTSKDPRLVKALSQMVGNKGPFMTIGGQLTLVIVGPDGQS